MDASIVMLLHRTEQVVERHLRLVVGDDSELTPIQFSLLRMVIADPGKSQLEISQRLGVDRATATGVFGILDVRGLISRPASRDDARAKQLFPTAKGIREHDKYEKHYFAAEQTVLHSLPRERRAEFIEDLQRVARIATD